MKQFLPVGLTFLLFNCIISLPLYVLNHLDFSLLSFVFTALFSLIWIVLILVNQKTIGQKDANAAFKIVGTNMGLKLGLSAVCLVLLYKFDLIQNEMSLVVFAAYYFLYTMLIARFTTKKMDELEK